MAFLPGVCAEMPVSAFRLFLGTLPSKSVEQRLLVDCLPIHYWFSSRKRVKEQANEFLELDMGSCDPELLLRYSSIPFIRRHLFHELVDRQLSLMETGKAISMPDSRLFSCLEECVGALSPRLNWERQQLKECAISALVNRRREPSGAMTSHRGSRSNESHSSTVEPCDILYLMRQWERSPSCLNTYSLSFPDDETIGCGELDPEMQARAFLCKSRVEKCFFDLASLLCVDGDTGEAAKGDENHGKKESRSSSTLVLPLEKKELKLFQRQQPKDAVRIGATEKMRPVDVAAYYRFMGERFFGKRDRRQTEDKCRRTGSTPPSFFHQALVGNAFHKIATHPAYLQSISMYWAKECGLDPAASLTTMPILLAKAVCAQQQSFPAIKLQSQFLYTSSDLARRRWRSDDVIPLMRLFPLLGKRMAEEMAASLVMEAIWAAMRIPGEEENPIEEIRLREIKKRTEAAAEAFEHHPEEVYALVLEGARARCHVHSPPVSSSFTPSSSLFDDNGEKTTAEA